ncbi:MAG: carboxypeptidase regulatory-like domain-containing protein, partial [Gemmatimonadota bacterium]
PPPRMACVGADGLAGVRPAFWPGVCLCLALASFLVPSSALAQAPVESGTIEAPPPGRIVGVAFDSTAAQPFDSAAVLLLDAGGVEVRDRVWTDADGRFSFDAVPAGEHVVVLQHDHLANLRLTPILRTVAVESSGESTVRLDSPSLATMWPLLCDEALEDGVSVVVGRIVDSVTGVPQPGLTAAARWWTQEAQGRSVVSRTDAAGLFTLCGIPSDRPVILMAMMLDGSTVEVRAELAPAMAHHRDLELHLARAGAIQGVVSDAETGEPIPDAAVTLVGTDYRTVTGPDGWFGFSDLEQDRYLLEMEHLAYGRQQKELLLGSRTLDVDARFSARAIELEGVTVTVLQPRLEDEGFYHRRRLRGATQATFLTAEELGARHADNLAWALRNVTGTWMRMIGDNGPYLEASSRGVTCSLPVFLDGMLMDDGVFNLRNLDLDEILAVEVYPPDGVLIALPREFEGRLPGPPDAGCGGLLIWTR